MAGVFELENRWLRCMNNQPEPMTLLVTLFDDYDEVITFLFSMLSTITFVYYPS
jgi:hypothetical protein